MKGKVSAHTAFTPKVIPIDATLMDLLNFLPSAGIPEVRDDSIMKRSLYQEILLHSFVYAYRSYMMGKQDIKITNETGDVQAVVAMCLTFGPQKVRILQEVGITTREEKANLPHGYIDLVISSAHNANSLVAIKFEKLTTDIKENVKSLSATSVKTPETFAKVESDRQCIVELLAFSEVV